MRVFIAIEIPDEMKQKLATAQESLKVVKGVKWTEPKNFHLTLKFLGEIDQGLVSRLTNELNNIANLPPFSLEFTGAGVFPNERRPRVVWIGIKDGLEPLFALAQNTEKVCQDLGFESESRPYSAHLTLGRIRYPSPMPALIDKVHEFDGVSFGKMEVKHFTLMQSTLMPSGPVYKALQRINLIATN